CPDCRGKRLKPDALLYRVKIPARLGESNTAFPLTPALSLRARERPTTTSGEADDREKHDALPMIPPRLWGEGERKNMVEMSLADFYLLPVDQALAVINHLAATRSLSPNDPIGLVLCEVRSRLEYLAQVGLGYLTLDRPTRTLSGGETERVNLTACLGTRLVNTLFVLDEPSG